MKEKNKHLLKSCNYFSQFLLGRVRACCRREIEHEAFDSIMNRRGSAAEGLVAIRVILAGVWA